MEQYCTDKNGNSAVQPTETSFTRVMANKSGSTVNLTNKIGLLNVHPYTNVNAKRIVNEFNNRRKSAKIPVQCNSEQK